VPFSLFKNIYWSVMAEESNTKQIEDVSEIHRAVLTSTESHGISKLQEDISKDPSTSKYK